MVGVKISMAGRKDYIYLSNPEADLTQKEIRYDFSEKGAVGEYVRELATAEAEVVLIDSKYQREATVVGFENGVATFRLKGLSGH